MNAAFVHKLFLGILGGRDSGISMLERVLYLKLPNWDPKEGFWNSPAVMLQALVRITPPAGDVLTSVPFPSFVINVWTARSLCAESLVTMLNPAVTPRSSSALLLLWAPAKERQQAA